MKASAEYDEDKHCPVCKGEGKFVWPDQTKEFPCGACKSTGELFAYLKREVIGLRAGFENLEKSKTEEINRLDSWIQEHSSCKTCKGNRHKTPGGCPCKECGLVGDQPWGG